MHFRILKMIATSGFLTALECTKFVFDPLAELTALPRPMSVIGPVQSRYREAVQ